MKFSRRFILEMTEFIEDERRHQDTTDDYTHRFLEILTGFDPINGPFVFDDFVALIQKEFAELSGQEPLTLSQKEALNAYRDLVLGRETWLTADPKNIAYKLTDMERSDLLLQINGISTRNDFKAFTERLCSYGFEVHRGVFCRHCIAHSEVTHDDDDDDGFDTAF